METQIQLKTHPEAGNLLTDASKQKPCPDLDLTTYPPECVLSYQFVHIQGGVLLLGFHFDQYPKHDNESAVSSK